MFDFNMSRFFSTSVGRILISLIWGFGLSAVFKKVCQGRNCQVIKYQGPNPEEVKRSYYKYGQNNCYQYTPYITKCHSDS